MPTAIPQTSVSEVRSALIPEVQGAAFAGTTSGAGSTTTAVDAAAGGYGSNRFRNWWLLRDATSEVRKISAFTTSSGTYTWLVAMATQFDTGSQALAYSLFKFDPTLITKAIQAACETSFRVRQIYRPARTFIVPSRNSQTRQRYSLPSSLQRVWRLRWDGGATEVVDEALTTSYSGWTNVSGAGQVASGAFSFTTVANTNIVVRSADPQLDDGYVSLDVAGDTDATNYDILCPVFRYLDNSNYMFVMLWNDVSGSGLDEVRLMARIAGTDAEVVAATLTTTESTRYRIEAYYVANKVQVWVDGRQYIDHTMTMATVALLAGKNVGIREVTSGSPSVTTAAVAFRAHRVVWDAHEVVDWAQDGDMLVVGSQYTDTGLLYVDGGSPLTAPGNDTASRIGAATLNSADATDVMEISSSDPAWRTFLKFVEYHLYEMLSKPGVIDDPAEAEQWKDAAQIALSAATSGEGMRFPLPTYLEGVP